MQVMSENPYRLARDICGIGFKTADAIAMKLGIEKTAMIVIRSGISSARTEAMDEGHCGLPMDERVPLAEKLLEVPQEQIYDALDLELAEGSVVADSADETSCVFLAGLHRERGIAERLLRLAAGTLPWAGLRRDHPQKPRLGISSCGHPDHDATLRHAAAKSALYRRYPRQEAGGTARSEEGGRHRGSQCFGATAVFETA